MYAVVGCRACDALWIVEASPETTGCPRCGRRYRVDHLRALVEADDEAAARRARAAILADRQGVELPDDPVGPGDIDEPAVTDEEYLAAAGLDADAIEEATAPAARERPSGPRAVVEHAIRSTESPTADDVVDVAGDHGVSASRARRALARLVRAGAATERDGVYRLL